LPQILVLFLKFIIYIISVLSCKCFAEKLQDLEKV